MSAVPLPGRVGPTLVAAGAATLVAFAWPLLASTGGSLSQGEVAPLVFAALIPVLIAVVLAEITGGGLDAKAVAMLAVLAALGAVLRPLGAGAGGIELVFFMIVLGGRVFGPGFGFVLGAATLLVSALVTAGVGPWLPYQMLGAAWVGMGAGLLPAWRGRREIGLLAVYAVVAAFGFGLAMNLSFWPFAVGADTGLSFVAGDPLVANLRRFALFSVVTSLGWEVGRAVTTVVMIALFGGLTLRALRRVSARAAFEAAPVFHSDT